MDRLYNSLLREYKSPFGAVRAGEPVRFCLTIPEQYGFVEPRLVLCRDGGETAEHQMPWTGTEEGVCRFELTLTVSTVGLYFYHFDLYSDFRKIWRSQGGEGVIGWEEDGPAWQLTVYERDFATPESLKGSLLYQIFPDRFYEGRPNKPMPFPDRVYREHKQGEPYFWPNETGGFLNCDYYGGDFEGIRQKLPYLKSMGVGWVYLNPIFEAHANHRYNTADYLNADPLLGTNAEFSRLCAEAKQHGIRIILDGVFSHTGSDSLYFNREGRYGVSGAYHDPASPYYRWYDFGPQYACGYRSWWGFASLPEVNENDPAYQEFICGKGGVIDTWLSRGASGFRLDVADELPDNFIRRIRKAVKAHGEDCYLLGEVWEDATTKMAYNVRRTYLLGKGLDAVMNYPFRTAILDFVKGGGGGLFAERVMEICEHYPAPALHTLMNFLASHDTERTLTALADEPVGEHDRYWQSKRRVKGEKYEEGIRQVILAYTILYTLPGVPCIYYGDEMAMQGYKDPFNRAYYNWEGLETRLRPALRSLAELRQSCDAFKEGPIEFVAAGQGVLHYRRIGPTQTADIIVNHTPKLLLRTAADGQTVEVNPRGHTVVVSENLPSASRPLPAKADSAELDW